LHNPSYSKPFNIITIVSFISYLPIDKCEVRRLLFHISIHCMCKKRWWMTNMSLCQFKYQKDLLNTMHAEKCSMLQGGTRSLQNFNVTMIKLHLKLQSSKRQLGRRAFISPVPSWYLGRLLVRMQLSIQFLMS